MDKTATLNQGLVNIFFNVINDKQYDSMKTNGPSYVPKILY